MIGKTSKPVIEILTGSLVSGHRSGQVDVSTSPRSQMDSKTQSPRGLKKFDFGGVGLGIVVALEKTGGAGNEIPANKALFSRNFSRSNPIPVSSPRNSNSSRNRRVISGEMEMESSEEHTVVTSRGPSKPSHTKVQYSDEVEGVKSSVKSNRASVFHISPARLGEAAGIPAADFLSCCNLCQKKLHGKDIYMYRGEKAFCSTECRYSQMVMDERKEKCSSEATRQAEVAGSPYANGQQIFTTGILAI